MKFTKILLTILATSFLVLQSCNDEPIQITQNTPEDLRGTIVSVETLQSYSQAQVDSIISAEGLAVLNIQAKNGIDLLKLTYRTTDQEGNLVYASGALSIPTNTVDSIPPPIATYCHGTSISEQNIPSAENQETLIGTLFASEGFVVTMPDYLGFGPSPGFHPYHIAKTEASATIDMIRASSNYMNNNEIEYRNEHYVFGYSQGGHAAMATVKTIEEMESDEINLVAAAPMSGAYDLSETQATTFTNDSIYDAPYYLPFILLAYNDTYNLYENISDFLVSPWDSLLPPLFDGYHSPSEVDAIMPDTPNQIIQPNILEDFKNNPDNAFRSALAENNLYDWTPKTDMIIYYCSGDNLVLSANSELACATFEANGSTANIECEDSGAANHSGCVLPSLLKARIWFKDLAGLD